MSEVLSALSHALDITEGQPRGHAERTCLIGMRLGEQVGLPEEQLSSLFYALLLKDAGCSSNSAKVATLFGASDTAVKHDRKTTESPTSRRRRCATCCATRRRAHRRSPRRAT